MRGKTLPFLDRVGTVVRALTSCQCGWGSIPAQCHLWAEFVVGSHLALRVFSLGALRALALLPPEKSTFPHSKYPCEIC